MCRRKTLFDVIKGKGGDEDAGGLFLAFFHQVGEASQRVLPERYTCPSERDLVCAVCGPFVTHPKLVKKKKQSLH